MAQIDFVLPPQQGGPTQTHSGNTTSQGGNQFDTHLAAAISEQQTTPSQETPYPNRPQTTDLGDETARTQSGESENLSNVRPVGLQHGDDVERITPDDGFSLQKNLEVDSTIDFFAYLETSQLHTHSLTNAHNPDTTAAILIQGSTQVQGEIRGSGINSAVQLSYNLSSTSEINLAASFSTRQDSTGQTSYTLNGNQETTPAASLNSQENSGAQAQTISFRTAASIGVSLETGGPVQANLSQQDGPTPTLGAGTASTQSTNGTSDSVPLSAIQRLQQIIDSSDEQGVVSIKRGDLQGRPTPSSSPIPATIDNRGGTPGNVAAKFDDGISPSITVTSFVTEEHPNLIVEPNKAVPSAAKQVEGLRQDAQQQYLETRIQNNNSFAGEQETSGNQQQSELAQQSTQAQASTASTGSSDSSGIFSIPTTSTTDHPPLAQHTEGTRPPVFTNTPVQDQEIIEQVINRFRITNRTGDSHIVVKLHPAELGEMKIDITMKEGSIRANVVAQTQVVQEVLEKNINKLKSVLESQGYNVEEINVSSESDTISEFNSFDQQFFGQSQYSPSEKNRSSHEIFDIEELTADHEEETAPGVDLKI